MRIRSLCAVLCLPLLSFSVPSGAHCTERYNVVFSCPNTQKQIALTFDDGPHPRYTAEILDILKEYGVKATFFAVGENAVAYPELIRREAAEGHEIGNHTATHQKGLGGEALQNEIRNCQTTLESVAGITPHLFRPPEGKLGEHMGEQTEKWGYTVVLWNLDTRDWAHTPSDAICSYLEKNVAAGDIILMHDYVGGAKSPTPEALRLILPKLLAEGYTFVTVSELIAAGKTAT